MGATYEGNAFCLRIAGGADGRSRVDAADLSSHPVPVAAPPFPAGGSAAQCVIEIAESKDIRVRY
jgi:hypothetical protein